MPEELYDSHDYCLLVDELEALQAELAEVVADKINLINAAMDLDNRNNYHYAAHDIGYRDMERKLKYLEADYAISNRELLIKQVEIDRLTAELADWKADAERFIQLANFNNKRAGEYFELHEQLVAKYSGEK